MKQKVSAKGVRDNFPRVQPFASDVRFGSRAALIRKALRGPTPNYGISRLLCLGHSPKLYLPPAARPRRFIAIEAAAGIRRALVIHRRNPGTTSDRQRSWRLRQRCHKLAIERVGPFAVEEKAGHNCSPWVEWGGSSRERSANQWAAS